MAHTVVFRPQAEDEVLEARRWYESRSPGLGRRFAAAAEALLTRIAVVLAVHGKQDPARWQRRS